MERRYYTIKGSKMAYNNKTRRLLRNLLKRNADLTVREFANIINSAIEKEMTCKN